ncbi:MAG: hypothetical protein AB1757_29080 [Acidobacteriota bacterium]
MTTRIAYHNHITNAKPNMASRPGCRIRVVRFSGDSNSLADNYIQVKAQDAQSDVAGTISQKPVFKKGEYPNVKRFGRVTKNLLAGERLTARAGLFLPTRAYQKAKASCIKALIVFYLCAIIFGYLLPDAEVNVVEQIRISVLFNLRQANTEPNLPGLATDLNDYLKLSLSYTSICKPNV